MGVTASTRRLLPRPARPAHAAAAARAASGERAARSRSWLRDAARGARGASIRRCRARAATSCGSATSPARSGLFGVVLQPVAKARIDAMLDGMRALRHGLELGRLREPDHPDLSRDASRTATRWDAGGPCLRLRDRPRGSRRPDRRSRRRVSRASPADRSPRRSAAARPRRGRPPARAARRGSPSGVPSAMIRPRSSTMTRSAWPNTTSMSCSVNSTAMPLRAREVGGELHQAAARARRHPGGRLVHQQQARRAGERQRELDALGVAVGERRAALVGEARHPDALEQRVGLGRERRRVARAAMPLLRAGVREQRELHVLAHRHRRERRGDLERAADAAPRDRARRRAVDARARERAPRRRRARAGR